MELIFLHHRSTCIHILKSSSMLLVPASTLHRRGMVENNNNNHPGSVKQKKRRVLTGAHSNNNTKAATATWLASREYKKAGSEPEPVLWLPASTGRIPDRHHQRQPQSRDLKNTRRPKEPFSSQRISSSVLLYQIPRAHSLPDDFKKSLLKLKECQQNNL